MLSEYNFSKYLKMIRNEQDLNEKIESLDNLDSSTRLTIRFIFEGIKMATTKESDKYYFEKKSLSERSGNNIRLVNNENFSLRQRLEALKNIPELEDVYRALLNYYYQSVNLKEEKALLIKFREDVKIVRNQFPEKSSDEIIKLTKLSCKDKATQERT